MSLVLSRKGIFAGSATSIISNPVWVIQTAQTVSGMDEVSKEKSGLPQKRLGLFATAAQLLRTGGPSAFFRGLGPALVLVVNPVLQYTVFEQLKNALVRRRRMAGRVSRLLTDWDFFLLGAISKLGMLFRSSYFDEAMLIPRMLPESCDRGNIPIYVGQIPSNSNKLL